MVQVTKFAADNNFPEIDITKSPDCWHKLESETFKGAYIFKSLALGKKEVIVLTVYNYRSGETLTERFGEAELTKSELAKVKKQFEEQEAAALKERARKHEQCRAYANEQFPTFQHTTCESNAYLARKIPRSEATTLQPSLGCSSVRSRVSLLGQEDLICPIVDIEGNLWNYQSISVSGEKQVLIGGKFQGLFIPILPDSKSISDLSSFDKVYVVEGFSTGLSVFIALKGEAPVLCAISSTNILSVVTQIRGVCEKASIIICADNDSWKRDQENTGEAAAIDVVSRVDGCAFTLPDFSRCSPEQLASKPTDYNDLHNLQGIGEVAAQIGSVVLSRPRIIYPLGYNLKNYYFTTSKVPQILSISEFTETDILRLAPLSYWEPRFPREKGSGFDVLRVKNMLIDQCQSAGLFESNRLRGRGLYEDEGRVVLHIGDKIRDVESGTEKDLADVKTSYYYDPRPRWDFKGETPDKDLIQKIHASLGKFAWSHPIEATLCLGWLLTTPLAGCLGWRSHLAVTSEAGSGKTTLLNALNSLLDGWMPLKAEGLTEAGLRQSLGSDAVPVILDEQDTNSLDVKAFDKIMTLFRMASSEGEVRRGTPSGKALRFNACFSGLIAGINLPKMKHADLTRFCIIELNPNNKTQSWAEMSQDIKMLTAPETARQLHTWTLENVRPMKDYIKSMMPLIEVNTDARTAQQYSNLIGASAYALGIPLLDAAKALDAYLNRTKIEGVAEVAKDSESCLDHLMDLVVIVDQDRKHISLGHALEHNNAPEGVLNQFKMRVMDGKLFVPSAQPALAKHFERTPWGNWSKALSRTAGSESKVIKVAGRSVRGILIPVAVKNPAF